MLEWTDQHSPIADRPSPASLGHMTLSHMTQQANPANGRHRQVAEVDTVASSSLALPLCPPDPSIAICPPSSSLSAASCPLLPPSQLRHRRKEAARRLGDGDGSEHHSLFVRRPELNRAKATPYSPNSWRPRPQVHYSPRHLSVARATPRGCLKNYATH
jgi:hypothetical protein